jgi:hypothetical protein
MCNFLNPFHKNILKTCNVHLFSRQLVCADLIYDRKHRSESKLL